MITQLLARYRAVCRGGRVAAEAADMTVVFDAGQNSEANFAHLAAAGLSWIGSVPASGCPDLLALPASVRSIVDAGRFGQLTACDTRRQAYGAGRRAVLTHSPELQRARRPGSEGSRAGQARQETRRAGRHAGPRQDPPGPGRGRAEITAICAKPWVRRVIRWQLTGDQPRDLRLAWSVNQQARQEGWKRRSSASTSSSPATTTGPPPR